MTRSNRVLFLGATAALILVVAASRPGDGSILVQADGADYVAFEAEDAQSITTTGSKSWIVVSTASPFNSPVGNPVLPAGSNASGSEALLADFGVTDHESTATYRIKFTSPGTYQLYTRESVFESGINPATYYNEDSFFRPASLDAAATVTEGTGTGFTEGVYGWRNTGDSYVVTAEHVSAPFVLLNIDTRERGTSLDRIAFSTNTGLSGAALDGLTNAGTSTFVSKPFLYYALEAPNGSVATDYSTNERNGTLSSTGTGSYTYEADAPAVLSGTQSLRLTELGNNNAARLTRDIPTSELNFSTQSWTFSGWYKRADTDNDDFIFHLGYGDGFGGGNELHLYGVSGSDDLSLRSIFNNSTDVNLVVGNAAPADGQWRHVALVHDADAGVMTIYVDGNPVASDSSFGLNLSQSTPTVVFGGHDVTTFQPARWFDGNLDDLALFDAALSPWMISELARGVSPLGLPEPSSFALAALGLLALACCGRRRRQLV